MAQTPGVSPRAAERPGTISTWLTFNSVRGPLFGNTSAVGFRFFGSQVLASDAVVTASFFDGFPGATSGFLRYEDLDREGFGRELEAGDLTVHLSDWDSATAGLDDRYPLVGAGIHVFQRGFSWRAAVGRARYVLRTSSRPEPVDGPIIATQQYTRHSGRFSYTGGLFEIHGAPFVEGTEDRQSVAVSSLAAEARLSERTRLFAQGFLTSGGAPAGRAGLDFTARRFQISAAAYHFDSRFPDLYPLFRPREDGFSVGARARLSEAATLDANVVYAVRRQIESGSNLFGTLSYAQTFGTNRPMLFASYSRQDVFVEELTERSALVIADRVSVALRQGSSVQSWELRAEAVKNQAGARDRGQLLGSWGHILGARSSLSGTVIVQTEDHERGAVAEIALHRTLFGPWEYLGGLRGAYTRKLGGSGAGVAARIGIGRRLSRDGWHVRMEADIPLSSGSDASGLTKERFSAEVGRRVSWRDLDSFRAAMLPIFTPGAFGSIEGSVMLDGSPLAGVTLLLDGVPAANTSSSGEYRFRRVPIGPALVSIDQSDLAPGIAADQGFSRVLAVGSHEAARADFVLRRANTLQVVVVACTAAGEVPVPHARITLLSAGTAHLYETSDVGAFRDELPPATYEVIVDPASVAGFVRPEELTPMKIDLSRDRLDHEIRLGCRLDSSERRSLRGHVRVCDSGRESAASAVEVSILGADGAHTVRTDASGAFRFEGAAPGTYLLIVDVGAVPGLSRGDAPRRIVDLRTADAPDVEIRIGCDDVAAAAPPRSKDGRRRPD